MPKLILAPLALLSLTACMSTQGPQVSRDYIGSVDVCPGLTGVSAIYSRSAPGLPVRCGPQTVSPVTYR